MFETEDGSVVGSVDRARLEELQGSAEPAPEVEVEAPAEEQPEEDLDALRAEAEAVGVKVDKRLGPERLREEIDAAKATDDEGEE